MNAPSPRLRSLLLVLAAVLALFGMRGAQAQEVGFKWPIAEKLERAVDADAQGLQQWGKWDLQCPTCEGKKETTCAHCARWDGDTKSCPECKGAKKAPCRACAGQGQFPDPLEKLHCPGCRGAGMFACHVCGGHGEQKISNNGGRPTTCVTCRGAAAFPCTVCSGARLVEPAPQKPNLKDAPAPALKKAKEQVDGVLAAVTKFEATGKDPRKEVKAFAKLLQPVIAVLPPLKRNQKAVEEVMGKHEAGSSFEGFQDVAAGALNHWKSNTEYYLQMQSRVLALALARAEHNAKVLAEKKGEAKK